MIIPAYLSFWGKARPAEPGQPESHPAAYHCLDVAAVCGRLLDLNPALVRDFAAAVQADPAAARAFLILLAAIHDIGKFSIPFQLKVPRLYPEILGAVPGYRFLSDRLSGALAQRILR